MPFWQKLIEDRKQFSLIAGSSASQGRIIAGQTSAWASSAISPKASFKEYE